MVKFHKIFLVSLGTTLFLSGCTTTTEPVETVNLNTTSSPSPTSPMGYEIRDTNLTIVYPLINYNQYEVTSYVNDNTAHTGIDILAPEGTNVLSVGNGTVRTVGEKNFYGYRLLIDYIVDDTFISITYGHLNPKNTIKAGDEVKQGQILGRVGPVTNNSGYSKPRLHFGVQQNYNELDPQLWLNSHVTG